jgi:hypothetical protein
MRCRHRAGLNGLSSGHAHGCASCPHRRHGHRRQRLGFGLLDRPASDGGLAITGYTVAGMSETSMSDGSPADRVSCVAPASVGLDVGAA